MKLYKRFGDRGFHTSIFTTFGVDFDAYESIVLSRLRSSGSHNNMLVADQRMLTHALSGSSAPPQHAGRLYSVSGATALGVFHSKIILQLGRRQGRLIIASANATASGLAGNLELVAAIECDQELSPAQRLIAAAWQYLKRILDRSHRTLFEQISWMEYRTPWLQRAKPAESLVELSDGTHAAFLATNGEAGIMDRFARHVAAENIERLVILSPYWDAELSALKELCARLQPKQTLLLIDKDRALFPNVELSSLKDTRILDISSFAESRFVHAKLFLAQTSEADHALFGSANCTVAALGSDNFLGRNEEACLYRRVPAGTISGALNLDELIGNAKFLEPADLPIVSANEDLPLDELSRRHPGSFESVFDTLVWRPSDAFLSREVQIELLTVDESVLPCSLQRLSQSKDSEIHFTLSGLSERPVFARVKSPDGSVSSLAIVSLVDVLRNEIREARGKAAERAAAQLDQETEAALWLLEHLDGLEASQDADKQPISRKRVQTKGSEDHNQQFRLLNYKTFVAGCHLRCESSVVGRNSLSGTEFSGVRAFLNRVINMDTSDDIEKVAEEKNFMEVVDFGDEVSNAEEALNRGDSFDYTTPQENKKDLDDLCEKKIATKRKQNREQIDEAVKTFFRRIRIAGEKRELTSFDMLRLRAMLAIVAEAGLSGSCQNRGKNMCGSSATTLQVLPAIGSEPTWPRLLGKLLFSVFGGKSPAIEHLQIEDIYDQVPDDLIECWAYCFWSIQACALATNAQPMIGLSALLEHVYALTGLRPEDALGERVMQVMERLQERFAGRLDLDGQALMKAHQECVNRTCS